MCVGMGSSYSTACSVESLQLSVLSLSSSFGKNVTKYCQRFVAIATQNTVLCPYNAVLTLIFAVYIADYSLLEMIFWCVLIQWSKTGYYHTFMGKFTFVLIYF